MPTRWRLQLKTAKNVNYVPFLERTRGAAAHEEEPATRDHRQGRRRRSARSTGWRSTPSRRSRSTTCACARRSPTPSTAISSPRSCNSASLKIIPTGPITNGSPFYTADVEHYKLNLAKANQLLDAAGHKKVVRTACAFRSPSTTSPASARMHSERRRIHQGAAAQAGRHRRRGSRRPRFPHLGEARLPRSTISI